MIFLFPIGSYVLIGGDARGSLMRSVGVHTTVLWRGSGAGGLPLLTGGEAPPVSLTSLGRPAETEGVDAAGGTP